jgi:hypothetical protein
MSLETGGVLGVFASCFALAGENITTWAANWKNPWVGLENDAKWDDRF